MSVTRLTGSVRLLYHYIFFAWNVSTCEWVRVSCDAVPEVLCLRTRHDTVSKTLLCTYLLQTVHVRVCVIVSLVWKRFLCYLCIHRVTYIYSFITMSIIRWARHFAIGSGQVEGKIARDSSETFLKVSVPIFVLWRISVLIWLTYQSIFGEVIELCSEVCIILLDLDFR